MCPPGRKLPGLDWSGTAGYVPVLSTQRARSQPRKKGGVAFATRIFPAPAFPFIRLLLLWRECKPVGASAGVRESPAVRPGQTRNSSKKHAFCDPPSSILSGHVGNKLAEKGGAARIHTHSYYTIRELLGSRQPSSRVVAGNGVEAAHQVVVCHLRPPATPTGQHPYTP